MTMLLIYKKKADVNFLTPPQKKAFEAQNLQELNNKKAALFKTVETNFKFSFLSSHGHKDSL